METRESIIYELLRDQISTSLQVVFTNQEREKLLKEMLREFNEGRSKSYFCIATTVMEINEIEEAIIKGKKETKDMDIKNKSKIFHAILDKIATEKNYYLKLRK